MLILFSLARKNSLCHSQKNIQHLVEFGFADNLQCHGPKLQEHEAVAKPCKAHKLNCLSALSTLFLGSRASNPPLAEWGQLWAEGGAQIKAKNAGCQQHPPLQCRAMGHPVSGHFHPSTWNKWPVDYKDAGTTEMAFLQLPYSFSISDFAG